jgi:predicted  nucleic acid-binding Zn-ribbon protein
MRSLRLVVPCILLLAACDTKAKEQLQALAHADSLRTDSLVSIKNDLLNEVMTSTQFANDINGEMAKLKSHPLKLDAKRSSESDVGSIKEERTAIVSRIQELVARLDSSEARVASLRARAARLSAHDSTLVAQVAEYEKTIGDLRQTVEQQKADYEATIAKQNGQIAALNSTVDTVTKQNVQLAGDKAALTDTVNTLTVEKNTAYYVIGTKDDLVKQGILVEEGHKRFLVVGGRTAQPARDLDPSKFTRIDRLRDRVITFPAGEYTIFSRQDPAYATGLQSKDGKLSGGLRIDQPERFWEASPFLIIVKS